MLLFCHYLVTHAVPIGFQPVVLFGGNFWFMMRRILHSLLVTNAHPAQRIVGASRLQYVPCIDQTLILNYT